MWQRAVKVHSACLPWGSGKACVEKVCAVGTDAAATRVLRLRDFLARSRAQPRACTAGYSIDPPAFQALFRSFDSDSDGRLGLPEFIALHLFMRRWRTRTLGRAHGQDEYVCVALVWRQESAALCLVWQACTLLDAGARLHAFSCGGGVARASSASSWLVALPRWCADRVFS